MTPRMSPTPSQPIAEPVRQHTPTPWKLQANSYGTLFIYGDLENPKLSPMGVSYNHLVAGGDMPSALSAENAIFIVDACNSHASLKASIKELESWLTTRAADEKHPVKRAVFAECRDFLTAMPKQEPGA